MKPVSLHDMSNSFRSFFKKMDREFFSKGKHLYFKQLVFHKYGAKESLALYEKSGTSSNIIGKDCPIWVCWWQGEEAMPDIVRVCYASLNKHAGGHPVVLVTENNYREYADMPEFLIARLRNHEISITHFSDVLRMNLLKRHGGIWVDSTIYFTRDIDLIVHPCRPYYSCRHVARNCNVVHGRWTSFFIACGKGNLLPAFMLAAFYRYWEKYNKVVTYLYMDYLFALAYDKIPAIAEMVESLPLEQISNLSKCLNMKYDERLAKEFCNTYGFHKLTYKKAFKMKTSTGEETIYARLMSGQGLIPLPV